MIKNTGKQKAARDGNCESAWQQITPFETKPQPGGANVYHCIIVGAGITGISAALLLQKRGLSTVVAEAHTIGYGTTGGTSAHINTFADTTYTEAESAFGKEGAQQFAGSIREGYDLIKSNIDTFGIDCDFETKTGFLYAETDDEVKQLDDVYKGCMQVGVEVTYTTDVPTNLPYRRALQFAGQAQFHPLKYLKGLAEAYINAGGIILENTMVQKIETADGIHTIRPAGISAKNVVYATHMPPNLNVFNFECAPYRSYVLAVKLKSGKYPDALVYDMQEPYHYVRSHVIAGEQLLLVGGNDHKTGHGDAKKSFEDLEEYVRKCYNVSSVKYRWSSQYYVPVDGFPYIGQLPFAANGVYCATGFNGNGMMLGSVSAKILADLVAGNSSVYAKLFSPARIKPVDGFTEFVKENADVAYRFVADRISIHETDSVKRITPGTGKVIEVDGKKIAVYRDETGTAHVLSPICTHAGCVVNWNNAEKTWDCPCHGARYAIDGAVLTGPATKGLAQAE